MVATHLLDIVFLLTAAVIAVPVFRSIGLGLLLALLAVEFAVAENLEASLALAREVLMNDFGDLGRAEALLESFRQEYCKYIDAEADDEARDTKSQS